MLASSMLHLIPNSSHSVKTVAIFKFQLGFGLVFESVSTSSCSFSFSFFGFKNPSVQPVVRFKLNLPTEGRNSFGSAVFWVDIILPTGGRNFIHYIICHCPG